MTRTPGPGPALPLGEAVHVWCATMGDGEPWHAHAGLLDAGELASAQRPLRVEVRRQRVFARSALRRIRALARAAAGRGIVLHTLDPWAG